MTEQQQHTERGAELRPDRAATDGRPFSRRIECEEGTTGPASAARVGRSRGVHRLPEERETPTRSA